MARGKESVYLVALVGCHHNPMFGASHLPKADEEIWCFRCREYRRVSHVKGMYRAVCGHCRFSRWYGASRLTAERAADKHVRGYPTHRVLVLLGDEVVGRMQGSGQLSLDDALDVPPF